MVDGVSQLSDFVSQKAMESTNKVEELMIELQNERRMGETVKANNESLEVEMGTI